jgi:hypothetical protein
MARVLLLILLFSGLVSLSIAAMGYFSGADARERTREALSLTPKSIQDVLGAITMQVYMMPSNRYNESCWKVDLSYVETPYETLKEFKRDPMMYRWLVDRIENLDFSVKEFLVSDEAKGCAYRLYNRMWEGRYFCTDQASIEVCW